MVGSEDEVTEHRGVVLDRGDEPKPVAQVAEPAFRVGGGAGRQRAGKDEIHLVKQRLGVDAASHHQVVEHLLVDVGVRCFLTNESAHVLGQFRIFDQRQRLVENRDEPALDRGQHDVEQAGEIGGHRMPGNPVQRDVGDVEVNLTGLDLDRTRIVFVLEPAWSQHETSSPVCAQF